MYSLPMYSLQLLPNGISINVQQQCTKTVVDSYLALDPVSSRSMLVLWVDFSIK